MDDLESLAIPAGMEDLQTIGASELGKLIGRSTKTIKNDASTAPDTLPPRFVIPGTRQLRWRVVDVRRWMEAIASIAEDHRVEQRKLAAKLGMGYSSRTRAIGHLGSKKNGRMVTAHMKEQGDAV